MNEPITLEALIEKLAADNFTGRLRVKFEAGCVRIAKKEILEHLEERALGQVYKVLEEIRQLRDLKFFGDIDIEFQQGMASVVLTAESIKVR